MNNILTVLLDAVQEAGAAILKLQKTGFTITKKANNDIVTQADLLVNTILKSRLQACLPEAGWLSEEDTDEADALHRLDCERVWVVDPIDGTKEYADNIPQYAISVALVEKGEPVLAAVFNPAAKELFHAFKNGGIWFQQEKKNPRFIDDYGQLRLLASRSEFERGEWDGYYEQGHRVIPIGSIAYKMALIATNFADATFSLGPKNEWDVAAGTLLVTEAGGIVTDKHQQPLLFNRPNLKVDGIIATTATTYAKVCDMLGPDVQPLQDAR